MMKLHFSPRSPFVRKVMVVLHETGQIGDVQCVTSPVAMDTPNLKLLVDNPLSKLPTLVLEDGTPVFDSRVICEYLSERAGSQIFPAAGPARLLALRRQALADGLMDALLIWRQERAKPAARQTPEWLSAFAVKTQATLAHLETQAATLAQSPFDIGVITIVCALSYLDYRFADLRWRDGCPALAAWHAPLAARASMTSTEPADLP
jgi:glutathione S-transferase